MQLPAPPQLMLQDLQLKLLCRFYFHVGIYGPWLSGATPGKYKLKVQPKNTGANSAAHSTVYDTAQHGRSSYKATYKCIYI